MTFKQQMFSYFLIGFGTTSGALTALGVGGIVSQYLYTKWKGNSRDQLKTSEQSELNEFFDASSDTTQTPVSTQDSDIGDPIPYENNSNSKVFSPSNDDPELSFPALFVPLLTMEASNSHLYSE